MAIGGLDKLNAGAVIQKALGKNERILQELAFGVNVSAGLGEKIGGRGARSLSATLKASAARFELAACKLEAAYPVSAVEPGAMRRAAASLRELSGSFAQRARMGTQSDFDVLSTLHNDAAVWGRTFADPDAAHSLQNTGGFLAGGFKPY